MKIFTVGGAVRDQLMGVTPKDFDYLVVDGTVQEMIDMGYTQVGADFPVFLHPETRCEYALARVERKTGVGYGGFTSETNGVTLEEDLYRRDLTINSMAMDEHGELFDPHGGLSDLQSHILRHTSEAFREDPLRVLRVARFAARYPNFRIHQETRAMMCEMVDSGELDAIPHERFTAELLKVYGDEDAAIFFEVLMDVGAMEKVQYFKHMFGRAFYNDPNQEVLEVTRFVPAEYRMTIHLALLGQWGDGVIPQGILPQRIIKLQRHLRCMDLTQPADDLLRTFTACGAFRQGDDFDDVIMVMGVTDYIDGVQVSLPVSLLAYNLRKITAKDFIHLTGKDIGDAVFARRVEMIDEFRKANWPCEYEGA